MHISAEDQKARDKLLNSLFFPDMNARKSQIREAHPETFEWLFKQDMTGLSSRVSSAEPELSSTHDSTTSEILKLRNSFHDWLKNGQQVYWISGKPGSGKSTLMNFIAEHRLTREYLQEWSTSQYLIVIESYLWNAGAESQKTYRGILATLLTQVLKRSAHALDLDLYKNPDLSQKVTLMDWSIQELEQWLLHCLKHDEIYFCVFIDGLDEAEADPTVSVNPILRFIDTAAALANVKCCVSSRPLRQFEIAFNAHPSIRLQDLNAADIRRYFCDNVAPLFESADMSLQDHGFEMLIWRLCDKADGVFLWACLAVGSLKNGIENCDDFHELLQRLESLPPELEDLYRHMWERQNKNARFYEKEASLFLNVSLLSNEDNDNPLDLLRMVFMRPSNKHLICEALAGEVSENLQQACSRIKAQITSRCAGLLEVVSKSRTKKRQKFLDRLERFPALQDAAGKQIAFVHRTARDFLLTSALGRNICSKSEHTSIELLRLLGRAKLCQIMVMSSIPYPRDLKLLIESTLQDRRVSQEDEVVLVGDIEKTFKNRVLSSQQHATESTWFTSISVRVTYSDPGFTYDFLGAELLAGWPRLVSDDLEQCIQGCNPAYRIYSMLCCLYGFMFRRYWPHAKLHSFLSMVWNHAFCSKELLQQIVYVRYINHYRCSLRTCAADILLRSVRELSSYGGIYGTTHGLAASFFENLLNLPFPQGQEIFLTMNFSVHRGTCVCFGTNERLLSSLPALKKNLDSRTILLRLTVTSLLQAVKRYVETRYRASLQLLSSELSCSVPISEYRVLSITKAGNDYPPTVKVNETDSNIILALLGYLGPSGQERFSDDLFLPLESPGLPKDLVGKVEHIFEQGEKVNGLTYFKELGLIKDNNDPEVGQWPPPFWPNKGAGESSERQPDGDSDNARDESGPSRSQDPNMISIPRPSMEDSSDEDQFFDATEVHA